MIRIALFLAIYACFAQLAYSKSHLNFALLTINGEQREAYLEQVRIFEKLNPSIKVNIQALESETYKKNIEDWLKAESYSDVMFWFGGERLNWYVKKGWILEIDDLWASFDWYHRITQSAQSAVTIKGKRYGLPIHYYHWGIYYNKAIFKRLGIKPPKSWKEFLAACEKIQAENITPIALGSKEAWPLAGWFDYINLRLNGLEFHQRLMGGEQSYSTTEVIKVFAYWNVLIEKRYFLPNHAQLTWREALPYLYRDMSAMYLMGNFWTSQIPPDLRDKFGVFPFPKIDEAMPGYEEAPTDVLFIPANVKNKTAAVKFLNFMSQREVQQSLNDRLGMLAPQNIPPKHLDHFVKTGTQILRNAEGASQFYDRDNPEPIAIEGMQLMQRFMENPGALPVLLQEFEVLREASFQ